MFKKECIAMLLAGGEGKRLGKLTNNLAKPAVPFGSKYRIIDFTLSNCKNSEIDTVGVLTQYKPFILNSYIGEGRPWELDRYTGGLYILPPYVDDEGGKWYQGTADAVYQNLDFVDYFDSDYVLIVSGDHIYKMDYASMLAYHKTNQAEVTIAVLEVPWSEASRFGIMNTNEQGEIIGFQEKPSEPKNNLASMGIYIFNRDILREYLQQDHLAPDSSHDFGKDVIPRLLTEGKKMYAYSFPGYWKDVGTLTSLWYANMELLGDKPPLELYHTDWRIYSGYPNYEPQYLGYSAKVTNSLINEGCQIYGSVNCSLLSSGVYVGKNSIIKDCVVMKNVIIEDNVKITNAIIGEKAVIKRGVELDECTDRKHDITLINEEEVISQANDKLQVGW